MPSSPPASNGARDSTASGRAQSVPFSWHADDDPDKNQNTYDIVYYRQVLVTEKGCDKEGPFVLVHSTDDTGDLPGTETEDGTGEREMTLRGDVVKLELYDKLHIRFSRVRESDVEFTKRIIDKGDIPHGRVFGFPYYEVHKTN